MNLRATLELRPSRGGDAIWRQSIEQAVATNDPAPTPTSLVVPMPRAEGTYVLEVRASWENPATIEPTTLIGRMIRRGRGRWVGGATISTVRRVTFAVLGDVGTPLPPRFEYEPGVNHDLDVDTIDLTRSWGHRPSASGRCALATASRTVWAVPEEVACRSNPEGPAAGLDQPTRLGGGASRPERRQWAFVVGARGSKSAIRDVHTGSPSRSTVAIPRRSVSRLSVRGEFLPVGSPRLLLDVCASGPTDLAGGSSRARSPGWSGQTSPDPVLVLVNRAPADGSGTGVSIGSITLTELASVPAGPAIQEPSGTAATRGLGIALSGPDALDRFGGSESGPGDLVGSTRNLAQYLAYCGASDRRPPRGVGRPRPPTIT